MYQGKARDICNVSEMSSILIGSTKIINMLRFKYNIMTGMSYYFEPIKKSRSHKSKFNRMKKINKYKQL